MGLMPVQLHSSNVKVRKKNAGPEGQVLFEVKHCHLQSGLKWLHGPDHLTDKDLLPAG